jgi:hypothetical protein
VQKVENLVVRKEFYPAVTLADVKVENSVS